MKPKQLLWKWCQPLLWGLALSGTSVLALASAGQMTLWGIAGDLHHSFYHAVLTLLALPLGFFVLFKNFRAFEGVETIKHKYIVFTAEILLFILTCIPWIFVWWKVLDFFHIQNLLELFFV